MANGWSSSDIDEGFNAIVPQPSPTPHAPFPASNIQPASRTWKKVVLVLVSIIILAGLGWFAFKYFNDSKTNNVEENPVINQETNQILPQASPQTTPTSDPDNTTLTIKDCSAVSSDSIFGNSSAVEDENYSCFISEASVCNPNLISITGSQPGSIEVIGRDADYCEMKLAQAQDSYTCKLSMNDLSFYTKPIGSIKTDPPMPDTWPNRARSLIVTVSFGTAGAEATNSDTGKPIDISCAKN